MSVTKKKSLAVADNANYSLTVPRSYSKGKYDMKSKPDIEASPSHKTLSNPKHKRRNGTLSSSQKSLVSNTKQSLKVSKSVFYTADYGDENERVYPASCEHNARPKGGSFRFPMGSVDDLSGDLSKSLSYQDLASLSRSRSKTDKYGTLRGTNSQRLFRSM